MKKSNIIIGLLFLIFSSCNVTKNDYLIIHSNSSNINIHHYFHKENDEYSRVYGNSKESDSITFSKINNDLLVNEFIYSQARKKRIAGGNIKYSNYYTSITDIKYFANPTRCVNVVPIENLDFLKNDKEIENIIKENCKANKSNNDTCVYNCNFILPQSNSLDYLPNNSKIISAEIIKDKGNLFQQISLNITYFDTKIYYRRFYYYQDKRISKIKTIITDSISTDTFSDSYSKINLK
jgi:hypothetical protein